MSFFNQWCNFVWYWCYYQNKPRYSVFPKGRIFLILKKKISLKKCIICKFSTNLSVLCRIPNKLDSISLFCLLRLKIYFQNREININCIKSYGYISNDCVFSFIRSQVRKVHAATALKLCTGVTCCSLWTWQYSYFTPQELGQGSEGQPWCKLFSWETFQR